MLLWLALLVCLGAGHWFTAALLLLHLALTFED